MGRVAADSNGVDTVLDDRDRDRDRDLPQPPSSGRERSSTGGRLEGDRSREKRKKRKSVDKDGVGPSGDLSSSRLKRKSKERIRETIDRSESVVRYCTTGPPGMTPRGGRTGTRS